MSAKVSGTTISLTRGDSLIIQISVNQEGKNSDPILDEKSDTLIGTFKTPPEIASNSKAVWSRWYKINGIGV